MKIWLREGHFGKGLNSNQKLGKDVGRPFFGTDKVVKYKIKKDIKLDYIYQNIDYYGKICILKVTIN